MGSWKKGLAAFLLLSAFALGLVPGEIYAQEPCLTLMVYMCGSDLESMGGFASEDIQEMQEAFQEGEGTTVLIMASGARNWRREEIREEMTGIYQLSGEGLTLVEEGPLSSMGEPSTLSRFLTVGHDAFPAERYGLVIWDHGGGPMTGSCYDELFASDCLTLLEMREGLEDSPFAKERLCFIGFDACLMASLETACALEGYADYLIASEEPSPSEGWDYGFLGEELASLSGEEIARRIEAAYVDYYQGSLKDITISCVDLSRIGMVREEMDALFGSLSLTEDTYVSLTSLRTEARRIGDLWYDLVDLDDLLTLYEEAGIEDGSLRERLREAMVFSYSNGRFRNGLSIYYPIRNRSRFASPWGERLERMDQLAGYRAFLREHVKIWLGEALAQWDFQGQLTSLQKEVFTLQLTKEEAQNLASARLHIVSKTPRMRGYRSVYISDQLKPGEDGRLVGLYKGESLFFVDEEGLPLSETESLFYLRFGEDEVAIPAELSMDERYVEAMKESYGEDAFVDRYPQVYLTYRKDPEGRYRFSGIRKIGEEEPGGKTPLRLDWVERYQTFGMSFAPWSGQELLPYTEWEFVGIHGEGPSFPSAPEQVAFLPLQDGNERFAFFETWDLQGKAHVSEMIQVPNENRMQLLEKERTLVDNELCLITLEGITLAGGPFPKLEFSFRFDNKTQESIQTEAVGLPCFDETMLGNREVCPHAYLSPGEKGQVITGVLSYEMLSLLPEEVEELVLNFHSWREADTPTLPPEEGQIVDTVRIPLGLDLSLLGVKAQEEGGGRKTIGGLEVEPVRASMRGDGVNIVLKIRNQTGEDLGELHSEGCVIDGVDADSYFIYAGGIPKGYTGILELSCYRMDGGLFNIQEEGQIHDLKVNLWTRRARQEDGTGGSFEWDTDLRIE